MSEILSLARWWSWRRQRLDRSCRGVDDCLRSVTGIFSAHPAGPLSLLARVPRLMQGMYEGAVEGKVALRLPAMRRVVFLLHSETAHLAFWAARSGGAPERAALRRDGIDPEAYERLRFEIARIASRPTPAEQIRSAVAGDSLKLTPVLAAMCAEGSLLRIRAKGVTSNAFTYVATRSWLGHALPQADPEEALVWLAEEYLRCFGPATAEDFVWWSGAARTRGEKALAALETVDLGDGLLIPARDARAFELARPVAGRVNFLPALDAYTMGYTEPSRARFADPSLLGHLYDRTGGATSVILIEGAVGGLWDMKAAKDTLTIRVGLFEDPGPKAWAQIQAEAGLVAGFLDARDLAVERVKVRSPISKRGAGARSSPLGD